MIIHQSYSLIHMFLLVSIVSICSPLEVVGKEKPLNNSLSSVGTANASPETPFIAFTDLTSGPDNGLADGKGVGTIVTLWGQNLGNSQGGNKVFFTDALHQKREVAYYYYWKNADGVGDSGPADLYKSHAMQEIAFSLPDSASGLGQITVEVGGQASNPVDFTVRPGTIYYVDPSGDSANMVNGCTWSQPCDFIDGNRHVYTANTLGNGNMSPGDIVYSKGVTETQVCSTGNTSCTALFLRSLPGTRDNPIAIVAYPGTRPTVISDMVGMTPYVTTGIVLSKFTLSVGFVDPALPANAGNTSDSNSHVGLSRWSRTVGNLMLQNEGTCFTGWSGSVVSGGNGADEGKIYGNHFKGLGCDNSSRYQHTLYLSVRNENSSVEAPELAYNYLDSNNVFFGIHLYDEQYDNSGSGNCGDMTGTLKIHHNVITNQRGAGINVATRDLAGAQEICWHADIEVTDNLLMNVGLGIAAEDGVANAESIRIGGDLGSSSVIIKNNTVMRYSEPSSRAVSPESALRINFSLVNPVITVENNVFYAEHDTVWLYTSETISASANSFYTTYVNPTHNPPAWPATIVDDPKLLKVGDRIYLESESPLINAGSAGHSEKDIYGITKPTTIGAVEFYDSPPQSAPKNILFMIPRAMTPRTKITAQ